MKYRHFKGMICEVIAEAKHSETLEEMIVYKELENDSVWVRPKKMFFENIIVEGKEVPRFELIDSK